MIRTIDLNAAYQIIKSANGLTLGDLGRALGCPSRNQHSYALALVNKLEKNGYLLSEDDAGRLYAFGLGSQEREP